MTIDWGISGDIAPKFWFGCSVSQRKHRSCIGTVYGLEWRQSKEFILIPTGWYCRVRWSDGHEQVLHEQELLKVVR